MSDLAETISELPLGVCVCCQKLQTTPAEGGRWFREKWMCEVCLNLSSEEVGVFTTCSWCGYSRVPLENECCPQCEKLKIGDYAHLQMGKEIERRIYENMNNIQKHTENVGKYLEVVAKETREAKMKAIDAEYRAETQREALDMTFRLMNTKI